jgi:hypothetical protein
MSTYNPYDTYSALNVGLGLIVVGLISLGMLAFVCKKWEVSISIYSQRASIALIIGGLILIVLHFLYLMGLMAH